MACVRPPLLTGARCWSRGRWGGRAPRRAARTPQSPQPAILRVEIRNQSVSLLNSGSDFTTPGSPVPCVSACDSKQAMLVLDLQIDLGEHMNSHPWNLWIMGSVISLCTATKENGSTFQVTILIFSEVELAMKCKLYRVSFIIHFQKLEFLWCLSPFLTSQFFRVIYLCVECIYLIHRLVNNCTVFLVPGIKLRAMHVQGRHLRRWAQSRP